jgi:hypothetical protein
MTEWKELLSPCPIGLAPTIRVQFKPEGNGF